MRPRFSWQFDRRTLSLGERTLIMGVLNVTPDSFSDGGRFLAPELAVEHGLRLLDEGADILDIGGESTRPGVLTGDSKHKAAVSAAEECDRVLPVIEALRRERPQALLSIDTYKSATARDAAAAGCQIVNDVSGLLWDPAMAATVASTGCGLVLMHTRGRPAEWATQPAADDIAALVLAELGERLAAAVAAGIAPERIVLDPGFGFGKQMEENYRLLARFAEFHQLGRPLLAAASRKGFLGRTVAARLAGVARAEAAPHLQQSTDVGPSEPQPLPAAARDNATLAASVAAALAGAHIVRVHAVRPAVEALAIADAILAAE